MKELWKIEDKMWGFYYVVAKDRDGAIEKVEKHISKMVVDPEEDEFNATRLELISSEVIT